MEGVGLQSHALLIAVSGALDDPPWASRRQCDMTARTARALALYVVVATGLTWLSYALDARLKTETGLIQTFDVTEPERRPVFRRTVQQIDLEFLRADPELPTRFFEVEWNGFWGLSGFPKDNWLMQ